jgi:hypothetical protein
MRKNILREVKLTQKQKSVLGGIAQDIFRDALIMKPGGGLNSAVLAVYVSGLSHGHMLTEEMNSKGKIEGLNL